MNPEFNNLEGRDLTEAEKRKRQPVYSGVLMYFPDAIREVAGCSWQGNEQHNPGQPLHWAREKSTDQHDCIARHLIEAGTFDTDGIRHSAKVAWRALAALQLEIEADSGKAGRVSVFGQSTDKASGAYPLSEVFRNVRDDMAREAFRPGKPAQVR
jgi:hypothetical protein